MKERMDAKPGALATWQELSPGGIITEAGNSSSYETGTWRSWRPVWHEEACVHCLTCWVLCPEEAIRLADGRTAAGRERKENAGIDYYYCKGCGLCVRECPVNKKGRAAPLTFARDDR